MIEKTDCSNRKYQSPDLSKMNELKFQKKALNKHAIVSAVDQNSVITYVNKKFV